MTFRKTGLLLLLFLPLLSIAQKKYVYTSIKVPLGEYIASVINKGEIDMEDTDGALFDLGYAVYNSQNFALETGMEYFIINPYHKDYYHHPTGFEHDELRVKNSAFAFQLKPVLKIEISEDSFLKFSNAFNYQRLYSSGNYYRTQSPESVAFSNVKTGFKIGFQPAIGFDFVSNEKLGLGLDIAYVKVNWRESMQHLKFSNQPDLSISPHQTSNVFIALKFIFK